MNVRQLGTGDTGVGFFVLTAVAAACLSLGLAYGLGPWERAVIRRKERFAEDSGADINSVSFADVLRNTKLGNRLMEKLDPSNDTITFHEAIMVWIRSHYQDFRSWAMNLRERAYQDEATTDQNQQQLTPIP